MRSGVCEHCWSRACNAHVLRGISIVKAYHALLNESECTPEQQAGPEALVCKACGRTAVHPYTKNCRACGKLNPHE